MRYWPAWPSACSRRRTASGASCPDALARDEIPLGASIIAVCDAFDAMVFGRPYRRALTPADAISELRGNAGSQSHPGVVDAFCALLDEHDGPTAHAAGSSLPR